MRLGSQTIPPHGPFDAREGELPLLPSAAPRSAPWDAFFALEGDDEWLWRMTVDCLDDVTSAQYSRSASNQEPFRAAIGAERRLLAQLDAALCYGPRLEQRVQARLPELDTPGAFFAYTLLIGCVAAPWSIVSLEECLRAALEQDEECVSAVVDALCLGSHPETCALARRLLGDGDARLRTSAAQVLGFRGESQAGELLPLLRDESPQVIAAALHALRHATLSPDQLHDVASLLDHEHEQVVARALTTGLCKQLGRARVRALSLCERGDFAHADAAAVLAAAGDEHDAPHFMAWLSGSEAPSLVRAVGLFGLADSVPGLIARLASSEPDTCEAAADALALMLESPPQETIAEPLYAPEDRPFAPNAQAQNVTERRAQSPAEWTALWQQVGARYQAGQRYRHGRLYDVPVILDALDRGPRQQRARNDFELRVIAGERAPQLEVSDWVTRQAKGLHAWQAWADSRTFALRRGFLRART